MHVPLPEKFDAEVSRPIAVGPDLFVRVIEYKTPNIPMAELVLVIDNQTKIENIRDSRTRIEELFRHLIESEYGTNLLVGYQYYPHELKLWRDEGMELRTVVMMLNYIGLACVLSSFQERKKSRKSFDAHHENLPGSLQAHPDHTDVEVKFINLLIALGMPDEDAVECLDLGQENCANSQLPWTIQKGPVKYKSVRGKIRYFKERFDKGEIMISEIDMHFTRLEMLIHNFDKKGNVK